MTTTSCTQTNYQCLVNTFQLKNPKEITTYFVQHTGSFSEIAATHARRTVHWIRTGVWISEKALFSWMRKSSEHTASQLFANTRLFRKMIRCEKRMEVAPQSLIKKYAESAHFLAQFILRYSSVGAILPSSKYLAKEIVSEIPKVPLTAPKRCILEIGPGTGVFTDQIIRRLNPNDELHLVEFNESFSKLLAEKYRHIKNVQVLNKSILEHEAPPKKYDYIVSGLPLNAFSTIAVSNFLAQFKKLSHQGTKLSYFDYILLPRIKKAWLNAKEREDFEAILKQKKTFFEENRLRSAQVLRNVPPARVLHHVM